MPYTNGTSIASAAAAEAAAWKLEVPRSEPQPTESTIIPDDGSRHTKESIIDGKDDRVLVDKSDIKDGGRYRSIVKIQSCFKDKTGKVVWMMGTGWLISPDVLVTAGHVVYDWGHDYKAATQIKCYIGYNGRGSVTDPGVQPRYGKHVITTTEWTQKPNNRLRDVAFIQVHKPFTGDLRTFPFVKTPESDSTYLTIVGYPGDKSLDNEEHGAQMYELSHKTDYDLGDSDRHMLEYRISTFGGQSGAPILRRKNGETVSIGTHCYGGGGNDSNSGNSIGGQWGNDYGNLKKLFSSDLSQFGTPTKIKTIEYGHTNDGDGRDVQNESNDDVEGFWTVLKTIAGVGSAALPVAGSFLGPIGGVLGTAAGALLGSVASLPESATIGSGGSLDSNGAAERAMLAEACLQAVLSLDDEAPESKEVMDHMAKIWTANAPDVNGLATILTPQLTECALDLALHELSRGEGPNPRRDEESFKGRQQLLDVAAPESARKEGTAFIEGIFGPTLPVAGEEAFSWLGPLLQKAVTAAKPLVSKAAKAAITNLAPKLIEHVIGKIGGDTESFNVNQALGSKEPQVKLLLKRALVADTALQALMALPKHKLDRLVDTTSSSDQTEGIFDSIKTVIQKFGPTALSTAKKAITTFGPVVLDAFADKTGKNESKLSPPGAHGGHQIRKKRSVMDSLLNNYQLKVN